MGFFGVVLGGGRQREEKKKEKTQFIVFCQPYKTPSGSKKKEENKRAGCNSLALLEALAKRFVWFGENQVRPRHFQADRIGGPGRLGERVGRGLILIEITSKPPVAQRAGGIRLVQVTAALTWYDRFLLCPRKDSMSIQFF